MVTLELQGKLNGAKLKEKYSLTSDDFWVAGTTLFIVVDENYSFDANYDISDCYETLDDIKKDKIELLWKSASNYEAQRISGSAPIRIAQMAQGGDYKAQEVEAWVESLWADYYGRRAAIMASSTVSEIDAVSEDFSGHGELPHTVQEIIFGL